MIVNVSKKLVNSLLRRVNLSHWQLDISSQVKVPTLEALIGLKSASEKKISGVLNLEKIAKKYNLKINGTFEFNPLKSPDLTQAHFNSSEFNFIELKYAQDGHKILRRIDHLLEKIEIISLEVDLNFYFPENSKLKELEDFLTTRGLNRAGVIESSSPEFINLVYIRRPIVMTAHLGSDGKYKGRFANQLFHYLYLNLVANRQGAIVQTSDWIGREIFEISDPFPIHRFPVWQENYSEPLNDVDIKNQTTSWVRFYRDQIPNFKSTEFSGYFQGHSADFSHQRPFILSLFKFNNNFLKHAQSKLKKLRTDRPKILAVHLRRGDYGAGYFFRAPCTWYEKWVMQSGFNPEEWIIYICCESPGPYRKRFTGFKTSSYLDLDISKSFAAYFDFYIMTQADYVIAANSSYSFMATLLNSQAEGFARPNAEHETITTFNPWNSPVLFRHVPSPAIHRRFRKED
jgi:hypothetical protein